MVAWKIRSCPRCGGDTFLDMDDTTYFDHCLQCGYMRRRSKECCPLCGDDMFLDIVGGNWFYRCYQCGYLNKDRHAFISRGSQHITYLVTSSGAMANGWANRKTTDRKPGRPKGSKDTKKRRKRRSALN